MALKLQKIEKVEFGDLAVEPKMTQELRLRVSKLKISEANIDTAREILSSCFGEFAAEVKEFMEKNLFIMDLTRIQVYLTQGASGLEGFEKRMDDFMKEEMKKATEKSVNE